VAVVSDEPEGLNVIQADAPKDRLTRLCSAMIDTLDKHPEGHQDERCVILLKDGAQDEWGIVLHNYGNMADAVNDITTHLRALLKTQGCELHVVKAGGTPPEGRA
jgi:hypothetical protein